MMYSELVWRLRSQCRGYGKECEDCNADGNCRSQMENEAADAIEDLENKLNLWRQDKISRWIPCSERLPEDGKYVLCFCRANIVCVLRRDKDGDWYENPTHVYMRDFVTHWMPLPEPLKEQAE